MKKLDTGFYLRDNVVAVAKDLIGKLLVTNFNGLHTSARITETEAYAGATDKASHAYGDRRTTRTRIMYRSGGCAYIYLCYGIHSMLNVVTNREGVPHAVLIRGVMPVKGLTHMEARMGRKLQYVISGPGLTARALGIHYSMTGKSLLDGEIILFDDSHEVHPSDIAITPRIGIDYAEEDAHLPYRFVWDPSVSNVLTSNS